MKRILSLVLMAILLLSGFSLVPPARAAERQKLLAITFDDGPGGYTEWLLDGLKDRGVKVTFFMIGNRVEGYADLVERAYREGHQVANHSWSHPELTTQSDSTVTQQVTQTRQALDAICGGGTTYLFRAPYGSTNEHTRSLIGMPLIQWNLDTRDWESRDTTAVKNMMLNYAQDGSIILLHDIHPTSVSGALEAIDELLLQGYEFVTVNELFRRRGVALTEGELHYSCPPNGTDLGPITAPVMTSAVTDGQLYITMSAQEGAEIYYTTDGSFPNQESHHYTGTFPIESPCTITAVAAYNLNGSRSEPVVQTIDTPTAQSPVIRIDDGVLSLSTTTPQATIHYTLDGNRATIHSPEYTGPITLRSGALISATAIAEGHLACSPINGYYTKRGNFFRDVYPGRWYTDAVDLAVAGKFLSGGSDGFFSPCAPVTRGEAVKLLYDYAQIQRDGIPPAPFTDVPQDSSLFPALSWAYDTGLVTGYGGEQFLPNHPISRQELAQILSRYLAYRSKILPERSGDLSRFADAGEISPWAVAYVEDMVSTGILLGDELGGFQPKYAVTRAQMATILIRLETIEPTLPGAEL